MQSTKGASNLEAFIMAFHDNHEGRSRFGRLMALRDEYEGLPEFGGLMALCVENAKYEELLANSKAE